MPISFDDAKTIADELDGTKAVGNVFVRVVPPMRLHASGADGTTYEIKIDVGGTGAITITENVR